MGPLVENGSYYALRRCPGASSDAWWANASRRTDAPPAMLALMAGRRRIEISYEDTVEALEWAERIDGWPTTGTPPLTIYPRDPRVETHAPFIA